MGSENDSSTSSLHIVMFPWFAFGHINPFVQLSNKLSSHGVQISFLSAPGNIQRISSSLQPGSNIKIIPLEIPTVEGLPPGLDSTADMSPPLAELLKKAVDLMQPQIKSLLINLKPQIVFFDFAQQWLPPIASELGIKTIFFSIFAAVASAYLTVPARLIKSSEPTTLPSIDELKKPPIGFPQTSSSFTTTKTHFARDFQYVFRSFHGGACVYDRVVACMKACDAIVVKSCNEMEAPYIDFMKTQYKKPVLLAGPVVPEPPVDELDEKWGKWLSKFPSKSVVYVAFGSEAVLKDDEIKELVLGLELAGFPFFVVLNFPVGEEKSTLKSALPEGFEERVKDKGIIHTGWVQQKQILAHDSVGCFVSHSGFSSVIEGLMNDCQLVLLPMNGEQFLNSKMVCEDMKAGVEVNTEDEDGHFVKEDLCDAVKKLMVDVDEEPGKSVRMNQKKWKEFLLDKEVHNKFITDFVMELKKLVTLS